MNKQLYISHSIYYSFQFSIHSLFSILLFYFYITKFNNNLFLSSNTIFFFSMLHTFVRACSSSYNIIIAQTQHLISITITHYFPTTYMDPQITLPVSFQNVYFTQSVFSVYLSFFFDIFLQIYFIFLFLHFVIYFQNSLLLLATLWQLTQTDTMSTNRKQWQNHLVQNHSKFSHRIKSSLVSTRIWQLYC